MGVMYGRDRDGVFVSIDVVDPGMGPGTGKVTSAGLGVPERPALEEMKKV
jgi:hypothetical protein